MDMLYLVFPLLFVVFPNVDSLFFYLAPNTKKCLKEEIHKDVLVTGDYDISEIEGFQADIKVNYYF